MFCNVVWSGACVQYCRHYNNISALSLGKSSLAKDRLLSGIAGEPDAISDGGGADQQGVHGDLVLQHSCLRSWSSSQSARGRDWVEVHSNQLSVNFSDSWHRSGELWSALIMILWRSENQLITQINLSLKNTTDFIKTGFWCFVSSHTKHLKCFVREGLTPGPQIG